MTPTRIARDVSTVAVAGIAAWSSWSHMVAVALRFGERPEVAYVLPLSVDGMLVVASAAMVEDKRADQRVRWSARTAFAVGVAASVAANIAAAQPTLGARIVAAWPAVALLLVVEILTKSKPAPQSMTLPDDPSGETSHGLGQRVVADVDHAASSPLESSQPEASGPDLASDESVPGRAAAVPARRTARPSSNRPQAAGERTADIVARLRAERPDASLIEVASAAGVSPRHVRRILASDTGQRPPSGGTSSREVHDPVKPTP